MESRFDQEQYLWSAAKSHYLTITHLDPDLKQEIVVTKLDDEEQRIVFSYCTNGEPGKSLLNGKTVDTSAYWEGEELIIKSRVQSGTRGLNLRDCWLLSPDGKTLLMEHRDDDPAGQMTILDRVAKVK
jgi:hypothetical protein